MPSTLTCLIRLLMAAFLGSVIGIERDMHGRAAGLRTHMLVSLGAALFTIVSFSIGSVLGSETFLGDPGRIAAQVVTGIGFLGAGTILQNGISIRGLTTAACLWIAAAIGMATAVGLFKLSIPTTCVTVFALVALKNFEGRIHRNYQLKVVIRTATLANMETMYLFIKDIKQFKITAVCVTVTPASIVTRMPKYAEATFLLDTNTAKKQSEITAELVDILSRKEDILSSFSVSCES